MSGRDSPGSDMKPHMEGQNDETWNHLQAFERLWALEEFDEYTHKQEIDLQFE